jgi:ParB family transcriptional regulator, chromosome partitioning protein
MTLQTVKLSQLRLSPLNVRRVKPLRIDQLAADMKAHGQLQNLVVYAEGNRFEVAAGGRRYRALKQLEKAKTIPSCHPVNVDVRDKAEAVELSLAENVSREDMHVADAVIAYGDLRAQGNAIRTSRW